MTTAEKKVRMLVHCRRGEVQVSEGMIYVSLYGTWDSIGGVMRNNGNIITAYTWDAALEQLIDGAEKPALFYNFSLTEC